MWQLRNSLPGNSSAAAITWLPCDQSSSLFLRSTPLFAQGKRIFVITDAEGVAGVCRQDQTDPKDAEMRQLLTGEINAAVQGFFGGGATDVIVWDGHDGSQTLSALTIDPRAKLATGISAPPCFWSANSMESPLSASMRVRTPLEE